jgi:hypothetical protein
MSRKSLYPRFLIKTPWWFDFLLAGVVYYLLKNWIPTVYLQNSSLNQFIHALPQFAEIFAGILIINGVISFLHARRNKRSQKSIE